MSKDLTGPHISRNANETLVTSTGYAFQGSQLSFKGVVNSKH